MAKRKTLGQVAFDAVIESYDWKTAHNQADWERVAAAVEREVLRRLKLCTFCSEGIREYFDEQKS